MNREIKFRAKSLITGEWVYGGYYDLDDCRKGKTRHIIVHKNNGAGKQTIHEPIDIKTLGQYTGFKDVNGKKIYEGDIVKRRITKKDIIPEQFSLYEVLFHNGMFTTKDLNNGYVDCMGLGSKIKTIKVIGSIYKNPELLEVEQ